MKATAEPTPPRRLVCGLLITVAVAMAVGRLLAAELVYEPSLSEPWPNDPEHPRRRWPATPPRSMPTFSSNDRSRWAAVRALVDRGTWVVGWRDRKVMLASGPAVLAAADPLQAVVLLEAGYDRRVKSDTGIVTEDGWGTVDKVLNPTTLEYYSTKPPLLTVLAAGEYWLLKKTLGWSIAPAEPGQPDQRNAVVRTIVFTLNVLPLLVYLFLLAQLAERFGVTDWGRLFVVTAACFGTLLTPFLITFNNHTIATCSVVIALYAAVRILSSPRSGESDYAPPHWGWFVLAGFFAGFTAASELPAAALAAGLGLFLLWREPRRTLLGFAPAAVLPVAALLASNYAEFGDFNLAYSKFGGPSYEYEGSNWRPRPGGGNRGIDWAKEHETKTAYAVNLLVGHHGWFSLTPINLLALGGMAFGVGYLRRPQASGGREPPDQVIRGLTPPARPWPQLAVATFLLSVVVIGYYIYKSNNYGGWTSGPRWLMWLTPLWLLTMLPIADRLGRSRWGRTVCLVLLALSVLSASYPAWNPWRHPWIYNFMDARGWVPY